MNNHDTVRGKKPFAALSKFSLAAIILMLAFFVVGASTMGVFNSPGRAYHATKSDAAYFYLDYDTNNQSGLANIYVNIGAAYRDRQGREHHHAVFHGHLFQHRMEFGHAHGRAQVRKRLYVFGGRALGREL